MSKNFHWVVAIITVGLICCFMNIKDKIEVIETFNQYETKNILLNSNKDENKEESKQKIDYTKTSWNLDSLYRSESEWKKDLNKFEKETKELQNYVGKVTKSATHLSYALNIKEKLDMRLEKLYAYVSLKKDINKNSYKYLDMNSQIDKVCSKYSEICSNIELEILKTDEKKLNKFLEDNTIDKKYKMYLQDIKRSEENYLTAENEKIMSMAGILTSMPRDIYELFNNMDKKSTVSPADYAKNLESDNREERKKAFENEFVVYNDNINTLSGLLIGQVKRNLFYSKARNYDSSLDMYLSYENVDTKVYYNLIETVNKNLGSLHRYIKLRKNVLGVDKVQYYDMFTPIVKPVENNITYDKAQGIIYAALNPLGKEYGDILYKAFNERWIDVYSNSNKVSGAYCMSVYDSHPYILLNYNGTLDSVSTLAHELGHAVYDHMSIKNQNYSNYRPYVFTQEVASITNEALLYEMLIKNSTNKDEKAYYLTQYIDLIKDTLYTQTMYAEFEQNLHEKIENGENLNVLVINDMWSELLQKYYGKDFEVHPLAMVGWSRIPHFYNSFYVYKYATGCSAAVSFAEDILTNNGQQNYIQFLTRGGSEYPLTTLKQHGINLNNSKPIEQTLNKFNELVKELEKTLNNK